VFQKCPLKPFFHVWLQKHSLKRLLTVNTHTHHLSNSAKCEIVFFYDAKTLLILLAFTVISYCEFLLITYHYSHEYVKKKYFSFSFFHRLKNCPCRPCFNLNVKWSKVTKPVANRFIRLGQSTAQLCFRYQDKPCFFHQRIFVCNLIFVAWP
jgi:hypothetical protein